MVQASAGMRGPIGTWPEGRRSAEPKEEQLVLSLASEGRNTRSSVSPGLGAPVCDSLPKGTRLGLSATGLVGLKEQMPKMVQGESAQHRDPSEAWPCLPGLPYTPSDWPYLPVPQGLKAWVPDLPLPGKLLPRTLGPNRKKSSSSRVRQTRLQLPAPLLPSLSASGGLGLLVGEQRYSCQLHMRME